MTDICTKTGIRSIVLEEIQMFARKNDVKEETSTLLEFDVIDLGQPLQETLLDSIRKEGIIIYEKV